MALDKFVPTAPTGKIVNWLTFISVLLVIGFIVDSYYGKGDFFGLVKRKKVTRQVTPPKVY